MKENLDRWRELYARYKAYTMIWEPAFWENLELCHSHHQPGLSVVECGVWKGGMMGAIAEALQDSTASYHLFDSFEGLPEVKEIDGKAAKDWQNAKDSPGFYDNCRAALDDAQAAMALSGVEDATFHPGWFEQTLPGFKSDQPISILRLDGDWYASTLLCLEALYPQVAAGGLIIIDDYFTWAGCSRAVHDYLSKHQLTVKIRHTYREVAYILKESEA